METHKQFQVGDRVTFVLSFWYGGSHGSEEGVVTKSRPGSITIAVEWQVPDPARPGHTRTHVKHERIMGREFSSQHVWHTG